MATVDKELESQLLESGNELVEPPSSVEDLLPLLYRVESYLSKVEQSPPESMQTALAPSLKALVDDKLLGHSDADVKVAVASCISEITRITAPEAPYDDDQMRVVFQLIVASFENLSDDSSRSYSKRTSILETVAKVRSCVVMLDLECDAMIVEMFQHFLNAIRDHHPENVFSSMETIMTLVLEESEDISLELLSPILSSLKNGNEQVLARKLGEKVLERCAAKVKPYLLQALKSLGSTFSDYSKVVATICQDADNVEPSEVQAPDGNMADGSKTVNPSIDNEAQEDKEVAEGALLEKIDPSIDRSSLPALSNGVTQSGKDDSLADSGIVNEDDHPVENDKDLDAPSNVNPDSENPENEVNAEEKPELAPEEGEKEANSSEQSTKPLDSPPTNNEKPKEESNQEGRSDDSPGSPHEGPSAEATPMEKDDESDVKPPSLPSSLHDGPSAEAAPMEVDEGSDVKPSSSQTLETASADVALASPSGNALDESRPKNAELIEKDSSVKEAPPSPDDMPKRVPDVTSESEARPSRHTRKKVPPASSRGTKASAEVNVSKKDSEAASDSEDKPLNQSVKKGGSKKTTHGSSTKQEDQKKPVLARVKSVTEKDAKKTPKENIKDIIASPKSKATNDEDKVKETPKSDLKRKRTPVKVKESGGDKDFGASLVGSKVKVWWPDDREYYDGTIHSFDPDTKKHKVLYTDGDVETLNLRRERWEFIGSASGSDEEDESSPDGSAETPLKKKSKIKSGERTKLKKVIEASPTTKKGGEGSSSKSKATTTPKSRSGKSDGKSKDEPTKSVGKSEDASGGKSKDQTPKGGSGSTKSTIISFKSLGKSKSESQTPKGTTKSKEESTTPSTKSKQITSKAGKLKSGTPKTASASKDKSSSVNGTGKVKSGSEEMPVATTKGKSPNSSKGHGSNSKSGKKRRRGVKG